MKSRYARPPFPPQLYKRFVAVAKKTGHGKRGKRWELMERLIECAEEEPWSFEMLDV